MENDIAIIEPQEEIMEYNLMDKVNQLETEEIPKD